MQRPEDIVKLLTEIAEMLLVSIAATSTAFAVFTPLGPAAQQITHELLQTELTRLVALLQYRYLVLQKLQLLGTLKEDWININIYESANNKNK